MNGTLIIRRDRYDDSWIVQVKDDKGAEIFYDRAHYKCTARIRYFIWKYMRRFNLGQDINKQIKL